MRRAGAAAVAVAAGLLAGCGSGSPTAPVASAELAPADTVVRDGDRVTGSGRIVQAPGQPVRFCGNQFFLGGPPVGDEPTLDCPDGVEVRGVDLTALADRRETDGVEGHATITGTWQGSGVDGRVDVEEQGPPARPTGVLAQQPPCPAPEGGWPRTFEHDAMAEEIKALQPYWQEHPLGPDRFAQLHVSPTQTLLGFVVPDEAARQQAERDLRPLLGDRMCVVVAEHSDAQLAAVRDHEQWRLPGVYQSGMYMGDDLQAVQQLLVMVVTEELAAAAAAYEPALVEFVPMLQVLRSADRIEPSEQPEPAADPRVPREGSSVTASGQVEAVAGRPLRLCATGQPVRMVPPAPGTVDPPCRAGVDLAGSLADELSGELSVSGTLRDGALVVEQHGPPEQLAGWPGLPQVPCPMPEGGWPDGGAPYDDRSPDDGILSDFSVAHPELMDRTLWLRPAEDRRVPTFLARDDAEKAMIERELGGSFPGRLCVVVAQDDVDLIPRIMAELKDVEFEGLSYGPAWTDALHRYIHMEVVQLNEELLEYQSRYPDHLFEVSPFLRVAQ